MACQDSPEAIDSLGRPSYKNVVAIHRQEYRIRIMHSASRTWLSYALLTLVAIPWYWRWIPGATALVFGFPAWVLGAMAGSALVSCYTAWLLSYRWPDELPGERDR